MKPLHKLSLERDVYSILRDNVLLGCRGSEKEGWYLERVISKDPLRVTKYMYPTREMMMEDHYEISKLIFKLRV